MHIRISNKNKNTLVLAAVKIASQSMERHKILTALREIPPSPQSQSLRYSFRRKPVCHLARMKAAKKRVAVKRSIVIGSCTSDIKTPLQLTTLNVVGASCDLFDVSMDI